MPCCPSWTRGLSTKWDSGRGSARHACAGLQLSHAPTSDRFHRIVVRPLQLEFGRAPAPACGQKRHAANAGYAPGSNPFSTPGTVPAGTNLSSTCQGICYLSSQVTLALIRDGAANTYMIGEKYIDANHYTDGIDPGDNKCLYAGFAQDTNRGYTWPPLQDQPGNPQPDIFGSAHTAGFNMVFCDASLHTISYGIDQLTHQYLSCINDGHPVDTSAF